MILILTPDLDAHSQQYLTLIEHLDNLENIKYRTHQEIGNQQTLTEIYLIGNTAALSIDDMKQLPGVDRVVRISEEYHILGRHKDDIRSTSFEYNGIEFGQNNLNIFAGLCAVDNPQHVELMMKALQENNQACTRMGAYKPRTNPYSFQGHGQQCLHYVFELAGKYDIKVIAMEITHESHIEEIHNILEETG
ncbi:MAG: 3-deoxy-7-phosphoheptulonate synthase, partial [Gammaproteobacteria bacterium]|nr:3-deoxy-7-phosphoheptulonate synthase [Gammaproteobacteria bacterium]